jgi:hypothetical protein
MAPERWKQLLLGGLVVVLLVTVVVRWFQSEAPAGSSRGASGASANARRSAAAPTAAPEVHLKALAPDRQPLASAQRNLFQFKPKPPPPPPPAARVAATPTAPAVPAGPAAPPPPPPIPLKFLGIVDATNKSQRLAVLSDGRGGVPFWGKEGDIIEGRYRILRIGNESIEMAYLDGRGRQVIRQSGS